MGRHARSEGIAGPGADWIGAGDMQHSAGDNGGARWINSATVQKRYADVLAERAGGGAIDGGL